jgi:two-component system, NarL family, nitrate/nitrite response regulator NarL
MASGRVPLTLPDPTLPRVAVAADQNLVAESVRAALLHRGYDTVLIRWPATDEPPHAGAARRRRRSRRALGPPPDIALLLSDLEKIRQVRGAQALVGALDVPWLVLAGVPRGPAWGALYERGAAVIVSTDIGLDDLCGFVDDLYAGRTPLEAGRRRELIRAWRAFAQHQGELAARLDSLTGREEEVLQQLYQGLGVRIIAERGDVTEATVRSQVKAILRKLEVNSQIAAVAAYQQVQSSSADRPLATADRESGADG